MFCGNDLITMGNIYAMLIQSQKYLSWTLIEKSKILIFHFDFKLLFNYVIF